MYNCSGSLFKNYEKCGSQSPAFLLFVGLPATRAPGALGEVCGKYVGGNAKIMLYSSLEITVK